MICFIMVTQEQRQMDFSQFHTTYFVLSCLANCFQDISRMESELANLDSEIQMQQESVEVKDAEMRKISDQIHQVLLYRGFGPEPLAYNLHGQWVKKRQKCKC